ncbi:Protein IQ-DOMAIN like [Actinidia chinensis var. chinensis]|uniref:Protein IQ-DOMAIN like n=1 Tax=Actinidia chinensis var. chinensis TaxID=1590841 RepID=A0A2R6RAL9_ACTCC|nr:Protein IQ-DOMAIN like [Actinidia chinensis var. chinensis]
MGSRDWFKNIIRSKKAKDDISKVSAAPDKSNGAKYKNNSQKASTKFSNGASNGKPRFLGMSVDNVAATRIQTAFRAYVARKKLRHLKGLVRLQILTQSHSASKQASTTLSYLHSWSRIQAQIRARRLSMVTEGRLRQKKLENQLKLEAKLHDLEVEWCGGAETMEEILARIHQREEATVKRERTLAYAFSHQWRANSGSSLGPPELSKANWGWSWMERWIAARPWESRVPVQSSPKKPSPWSANKAGINTSTPTMKAPVSSLKTISPNGKGPTRPRKLTYPVAEKLNPQGNIETEDANIEKGKVMS